MNRDYVIEYLCVTQALPIPGLISFSRARSAEARWPVATVAT
jgi:hypothetical protein